MRFGVVILPEARWRDARATWQRAEALGFEHAWTYDHLAWRSLRDTSWFGAIPTLTAAALCTERIQLGPLVATPNFRHPVPFAKEVMTLDDVSNGRCVLGLGAGSDGWDATMLGQTRWSPRERAARFEEFVALTDQLLREPRVSRVGEYYSADEARTYPGCVQQPRVPFVIGATGPRAMRVAAQHAHTWVTTGHPDVPIGELVRRLDGACAAVGRDAATLGRMVLAGAHLDAGLQSVAHFDDVVGGYAAIGVTDFVVHWPRAEDPFAADVDMFERIFSR